jgi:hypothetical protein
MQPNALQAPTGHKCRHSMRTLVCDRDQHAGVRPDRAWQDETRGDGGC